MTPKRHPASRRIAAVLTAFVIGSASCGGDDASGSRGPVPQHATDVEDAGDATTSPDADGAETGPSTNDPATGLDRPASVAVSIEPAHSVYRTGFEVTPKAAVRNGRGELIGSQDVTWTVQPNGAATGDGTTFQLHAQGAVTFQACTTDPGLDDQSVCGTHEILVNDGPPTVEVTKPAPGAWLGDDGADTVTVEGTIHDDNGEVHAFLNGRSIELDDGGHFSTTFEPTFGINHIEVLATDSLTRTAGQAIMDVLWAPEWYAASNTGAGASFELSDGIILDLGQRFFDDGTTPQQPNEMSYVTKDLVDILKLVVENVDFMGQVPDPVFDSNSGELHIKKLTVGDPQVNLDITDQGAELYLWAPDVEMNTQGQLSFNGNTLNLNGTISAGIAGFAVIHIDKPAADQPFVADATQVSVSVQNAHSNFASPEADAVFELAEGALRSKVEQVLVDTLRAKFIDALPAVLVDALNSIESQLDGLSLNLDTAFTDPLTLDMSGSIADFTTAYRRSMTAPLATQISADKPAMMADNPGIPLATPLPDEVGFFETSRAQVGVRLALLNGLMHTLWETGFFEIDLTKVMPNPYADATDQAELSAKLQPVLTRPEAGKPYDLAVHAGQMEVTIDLLGQVDVYVVNIEAGLLMSLADNAIAVNIPDDPLVSTWTKSTTGDRPVLGPAALEGLILDQVWPQVETTLKQGLSFELPVPSLASLSTLAPTLTDLELNLLLNRPVDYRDGFIIFDTMLQGVLPLGP